MNKLTQACMSVTVLALCCGTSLNASAAPPVASPAPTEPSAWHHHHATFTYFSLTSTYSCDALEEKVRDILQYLGARRDLQVRAQGCPRSPETLTHNAWITVDFDTLAITAPDAAQADVVPARWTPFEIDGRWPTFIRGGGCELIDEMRPVLVPNFSWRNLNYHTDCTPHEITLLDFRVDGEVLKASAKDAG